MFSTFLRTVFSLFCQHEWVTRREPGRVYLECVNCLTTTTGIEIKPQRTSATVVVDEQPVARPKAA